MQPSHTPNDASHQGNSAPLKRAMSTRHLVMISLGGAIGTGLFLGSGEVKWNRYHRSNQHIWSSSSSIHCLCFQPLPLPPAGSIHSNHYRWNPSTVIYEIDQTIQHPRIDQNNFMMTTQPVQIVLYDNAVEVRTTNR